MSQRVFKMLAFGALSLGGLFACYRINQINKLLGTQIIEQEEQMYREENKKERKLNQTFENYSQFDIGFEMNLLQERLSVYSDRLFYFNTYQELNKAVIKEVIQPILNNYEAEQSFDEECIKILKHITNSHNFNNPVNVLFNRLFQQNSRLRQSKKGYIKDVFEMQNKLMTLNMFGLSDEQKQKIDILYSFFAEKELALYELAQKKGKSDIQEPVSIGQDDYLSKIQMI